MGAPTLQEIVQQAQAWDFLHNLPAVLGQFQKKDEATIEGQLVHLCCYEAPKLKAKVDLLYTTETFDYILVRSLGMNIYRDISLIYRDKDDFATMVEKNLPHILHTMEHPEEVNLGEMVKNKAILTWTYGNNLPATIGPFQLYIRPEKAIEHINGSIILVDYTDFARQDQFVLYYNRLRNEFFAETKIAGVFHATRDFDATTLPSLEKKLTEHLETTLTAISNASHNI